MYSSSVFSASMNPFKSVPIMLGRLVFLFELLSPRSWLSYRSLAQFKNHFRFRPPLIALTALGISCLIFLHSSSSFACDLCAVYSAAESMRGTKESFNVGLVNQFTHLASNIRPSGQAHLPNQYLDSNITQFLFHYNVTDRFSIQTTLPVIYRDFRRIYKGKLEEGSEKGIGDSVVLLKYEPLRSYASDSAVLWEVYGGVKLPTGSSDRLEELESESENEVPLRHGVLSTERQGEFVAGEDLALGSGSYDYLIGTSVFSQWERFFVSGSLQYAFRNSGDHAWHYGDDGQWNFGPGMFFVLEEERSLAARLKFSGEWKEDDSFHHKEINDSSQHRSYLGPELRYTHGDKIFVSLGVDFAIHRESSRDGVVPTYRNMVVFTRQF